MATILDIIQGISQAAANAYDGSHIEEYSHDGILLEKSQIITYDLQWEKGDLVMIDNKRFMHGRRSFKSRDKRDIVNIQTATANFGYGSTTRNKIS